MVRPIKNRKNKSRRLKRRPIRRQPRLRFPPVIPFHTVFVDMTLRNVITYDKQPINSRIDTILTIDSIFDGPWSTLRDSFSQVRVKHISIYVTSGVGFDERGFHVLNVAPKSEFQVNDKTTFPVLAALPGSKQARITQMLTGVWYPTGPDERSWNLTMAKSGLVDFTYMCRDMVSNGTASATFPLEITIDSHVRLRGVNYHQLQPTAVDDDLDVEFVHLATK